MLRDASKLMRADLDTTLKAIPENPADAAIRRLAKDYVDSIDRAVWVAKAVDDLVDRVNEELPWDARQEILTELYRLSLKVKAETVLANVGPKLANVLEALGATPRARAKTTPTGGTGRPVGKLQALRDARDVG